MSAFDALLVHWHSFRHLACRSTCLGPLASMEHPSPTRSVTRILRQERGASSRLRESLIIERPLLGPGRRILARINPVPARLPPYREPSLQCCLPVTRPVKIHCPPALPPPPSLIADLTAWLACMRAQLPRADATRMFDMHAIPGFFSTTPAEQHSPSRGPASIPACVFRFVEPES
jgi:hypothetical protein